MVAGAAGQSPARRSRQPTTANSRRIPLTAHANGWVPPPFCPPFDFVDNQVRLQLFVLAYNLGNFLRQAVLHWTLTTLRAKLIKIGAKVVRHSRIIVIDQNFSHR